MTSDRYLVSLAATFANKPDIIHQWIETAGSVCALLEEPVDALCERFDDSDQTLHRASLAAIREAWNPREADTILSWCHDHAITILPFYHPDYPEALRHIPSPPLVLYVKGSTAVLQATQMGIVGARSPSDYGRAMAKVMADGMAKAGVTVTSGLAKGIDAAAHESALSAGGATIAVLGGGLARVYPTSHIALSESIAETGAVISEFSPFSESFGWQFLHRNRIISGLSRGVVVVEAAIRSGSLSTARHALEQGRDVWAVPGDVGRVTSAGTNKLIQDGAQLATHPDDVLTVLFPDRKKKKSASSLSVQGELLTSIQVNEALDAESRQLLASMGKKAVTADTVATAMNLPLAVVVSKLTMLEVDGYVASVAGGRFKVVE